MNQALVLILLTQLVPGNKSLAENLNLNLLFISLAVPIVWGTAFIFDHTQS